MCLDDLSEASLDDLSTPGSFWLNPAMPRGVRSLPQHCAPLAQPITPCLSASLIKARPVCCARTDSKGYSVDENTGLRHARDGVDDDDYDE